RERKHLILRFHPAMNTRLKIALIPVLFCLAQSASAQNIHFEDIPLPENFPQSVGMELGSLHLDADAMAGLMKTNNVYRDASHLDSEATQLDLSSTLTSRGEHHLLVGTLEYYHQEFKDSAYEDMDL